MANTNRWNYFGVTDMTGKGSARRPMDVSEQTFWDNFDRIFGEGKYAPKQREDADGVSHCGNDVRTETKGADVPDAGKSGN